MLVIPGLRQKVHPGMTGGGIIEQQPAFSCDAGRYCSYEGRPDARTGQMTSATTRPTPAPVRPITRAAPVDRSRTRPRMNGPRSLTVTTTLRPPWVTLSLVPNGRLRWAQVIALAFMRWPDAVLLPDSLP